MVLLNDVKLSESARPISDELLQTMRIVFNGEIKPDVVKSQVVEKYEDTNKLHISFVDLIVLFCVILIITLSSVKFKVEEKVPNPYIVHALHAVLIVILFYVYLKIKG